MPEVQKNLDEVSSRSPLNIVLGKVKKILNLILSLIKSPELPDIVILPESVRYALSNRNSVISNKEIGDLLDPKYGFLGIWLVLKFYEDKEDVFFVILQQIIHALAIHKEPVGLWENLRIRMTEDPQIKQIKTSGKISFISRMGFVEFCEALGHLYNDHEKYDSTVLVANSGLMGLATIIPKLQEQRGELIILFPKFGSEHYFYLVSFQGETVSMKFLSGSEAKQRFENEKILVIDDISSTGKTEKQVYQILDALSPAKIDFKTLIKFPDKREFVTDPHRGMVC